MEVGKSKSREDRRSDSRARPWRGAAGRPSASTKASATNGAVPVVASGRAVGDKVAIGIARFVSSDNDLSAFRPGEILMAESTMPEWQSVMQVAAAIVTNQGGGDCHAAIIARKLGVPAVVGTIDGASRLWTGATLTVSCAQGDVGRVYEGVFDS